MSIVRPLETSPLVAACSRLDAAAVIAGERTWTWRQVHAASIALARRLDGAPAVCNLCTSRLGFLVTTLAALRSRSLVVLPPSGSGADLDAVLAARPGAVVVGDAEPGSAEAPAGTTSAAPYLACRPEWQAVGADDDALAWQPAWDDVAVLLHTSGTTGDPKPQPKTLRQLATGALVLGERLADEVAGGIAAVDRIVCSVPPQHMFGLECSVVLPLVHGTPIVDRRPLLPADVGAAFAGAERGAWIATPMHLRSLVQAGEALPSCGFAVVSTMPLGHALARDSERVLDAPVLEIYGSTETGALAMRRTARETRWRPLAGVRLEPAGDGTIGRGTHFASPVTLLDELVFEGNGSFTLLGRQADLVKIAGRRASLAGLNLLLQELPGLDDGVFYLPATGNPTERLCLVYAGASLERAATRRWLRARLDPVFLPRDFIRLDRMPRSDNGKLRRHVLDAAYAQWQSAPRSRRGECLSIADERAAVS